MTGSFEKHRRSICDALQDLVIFVLFKEHEKHPWINLTLSKIEEWCQIAQNISFYFGSSR